MRTAMATILSGGAFIGVMLVAGALAAQPDDTEADEATEELTEEEPTDDEATDDGPTDDEPTDAERAREADTVRRARQANSPVELPGETYYLLGMRYRAVIVPKFMMNLFGDGGRTVVAHGVGPEFGIRKDGFETNLSMWFASYKMKETGFKAKSDPEDAWEIVESKIKVLYLTGDFLWSSEISPEFAINYGLGAGFGFVFGDLLRTQSYPGPGVTDPNDYSKCTGPSVPNAYYCADPDNEGHFPGYTEPSWASGGSKPVVFPWLMIQTGFRIKPHRNFVGRVDMGFGTSGFLLGFGADYGL